MGRLSISDMRKAILGEYPDSLSWQGRVAKMPNYQVAAIYKKFKSDGRFDKKKVSKPAEYRQMTIYDFIM